MPTPVQTTFLSATAVAALSLLAAAACSVEETDSFDDRESAPRLGNATSTTAHPSVSTLAVHGYDLGGEAHSEFCHAVLVAPRTALTAAHCFRYKWPALGGSIEVFGQVIEVDPNGGKPWTDRVHIKPGAIGQDPWTDRFIGVSEGSDLAIIDLPQDATGSYTVAKLFVPAGPAQLSWSGVQVVAAGHDGTWGSPAQGVEDIDAMVSAPGGEVLRGLRSPSYLQGGDSGGGAFLVPATEFGGAMAATSVGLPGCHDATVGGASEQVLVGIASKVGDDWAPTFTYGNRSWIASTMSRDIDGDGVCDADDNCIDDPNPGQDNCNAIAEADLAWGFDGTELGDACDPAPCGEPELMTTGFEGAGNLVPWAANGYAICWAELGRRIDDRLLRTPHNAVGAAAVSTNAATAYFCSCVDANGEPSSDPVVCSAAPNYCRLDPAELAKPEGGASMHPDLDGVTFWHEISLQTSGGVAVTQPLSVSYVDGAPDLDHRWAYKDDLADWVAQGWFADPGQDAQYGPGTDLAGLIWARDVSNAGITAHGKSGCSGDPTCSLVDGFVFAVQPDARDVDVSCKELPQTKPPPWWTYCPQCLEQLSGIDELINPAPWITVHGEGDHVTQWLGDSARDVTEAFSPALREAMARPGVVFAGPSEPLAAFGAEGTVRGMLVSSEGVVLGHVRAEDGTFGLQPAEAWLGLSGEQSFAATTSVTDATLFAVGDGMVSVLAAGAEAPLLVELDAEVHAPSSALRGIADGALWVVHGEAYGLALSTISLDDGHVQTHELEALAEAEQAWLAQGADGRIVVVSSSPEHHALWELEPGETLQAELQVNLVAEGEGPIVHAPFIDGDQLRTSTAVSTELGLRIEPIAYALTGAAGAQ